MKNYDQSVEINHNPNWPYIPDHLYRILIVGGSGSDKTNALLNLIKNQRLDIDKIYSYVKDPFESKYQLFINRREKARIKKFKEPKAFTDYPETNENLEDYNPTNKRKVLIVFDDMIPNKRELQQITSNHSSDINFKDFVKLYKDSTKESYSFLVNDATLPLDNPLRFRKNLL